MNTHDTRSMSANQKVGLALGATQILIGLLGFAVTGGLPFASDEGNNLILFGVNPLHNLVHLAIGAVLVLAALKSAGVSRKMNIFVGATYGLIGVLGFFIVDNEQIDILGLNIPDNFLHLAFAAILLGVGLTERTIDVSDNRQAAGSERLTDQTRRSTR